MTPEQWESVRELFHAALDLPPDKRPEFLRAKCAENSIRAEVESLLNAAGNSLGPIDSPALEQARKAIDVALASDPSLPLLIGRTLGQYEIVSLLGAGGMGQVYRARDRRLKRDVALKVLPGQFADDPERMARFQREAEVLASLNHPNIAQIYGIEDSALVMELVEGETLKGPLPPMTLAKYARQIAEGLEYAHERGVIHRDLKPANIKVTPAGTVKILDFGLAKARQNPLDSGSHDATTLVTQPQTGVVMGTPAYMSPEQASGLALDKRADIWSFGVVLWEMLTGARLFRGDSVMQVLASVLKAEIDFSRLPEETPAPIRELVARCLERDPQERLRDLGEARMALQRVLSEPGSAIPLPAQQKKTSAAAPRHFTWIRFAAIVTAAAGVAAASVWVYSNRIPPVPGPEKWKQITHFADGSPTSNPVISPDGHMLAFMVGLGWDVGPKELYVKILPDGPPVQLTHDQVFKAFPAFSPDGSRIAYTVADSSTWVVPVLAGGDPRMMLFKADNLTWIDSQHVLFARASRPPGLETALENGIGQRQIYNQSDGPVEASALSPDRRQVLVAERSANGGWNPCRLLPFDGSSKGRQVGPAAAQCIAAAWSPDGKWMYFTADTGKGFHLWRQRLGGGAAEQITFGPGEEIGTAIAPDGRSLYTSSGSSQGQAYILNNRGVRQISEEQDTQGDMAFSPDGVWLYYRADDHIWRVDLKTGRKESPFAGVTVAGVSFSRNGKSAIYLMPDGSTWLADLNQQTPPRRIPLQGAHQVQIAKSGRVYFLVEAEDKTDAGTEIQDFSTFGARASTLKKESPGGRFVSMLPDGSDRRDVLSQVISQPRISPDERIVVGYTEETGLAAFPLGGGAPRLICAHCELEWSSDGKYVLLTIFLGLDRDQAGVFAVPLNPGAMLPPLPAEGFRDPAEIMKLPHVVPIPGGQVSALGPDPTAPAYINYRDTRNIVQIPLR